MVEAASPADVRELLDRMQIDELHSRYLFALDWLDADVIASLFTQDGVIDWAFGVIEGRDAIRDAVTGMQAAFGKTETPEKGQRPSRLRHFVTNKIMQIDGDHARTLAFWFELDNDNRHRWPYVGAYGHYEDELVRTSEGWLFKRRAIFNELMDERAASWTNPAW